MGKRRNEDIKTDQQRKEKKRIKKEQKERKSKGNDSSHIEVNVAEQQLVTPSCGDGVFFQNKLELTISLLPSALSNVLTSVEDSLRLFLLKYSDGIGGIMLAFENVRILSDNNCCTTGMILDELPHIHYKVTTDALVFNPIPGSKIWGTVSDATFHSHLSLVVYNYFNASIPADMLRESGFEFDDVQLQWYSQQNDTASPLNKDDRIEFICHKLYESGGIISIEGTNPALITN